ncbi:hypothetical protein [Vibrio splendidus]|uniref:hypothetical protein n=1 Tax=Vibrio splendidus TaxID=29497 RepID=UPI002469B420|nr:hypothetical protein [Vibrio splendidus]MDH5915066.1 hypothetical protein [Vibrio splendidus]
MSAEIKHVEVWEKPRNGKYASDSGAYEMVLRMLTPVVDPGDQVIVEQLFTGYGQITSSKLTFYPSDDVFCSEESYVLQDLYENEDGNFCFGKTRKSFQETGITFILTNSGLRHPGWDQSTLFLM